MRSALLLSAVAVGSVAALNHKHAAFHRRHEPSEPIDYDLSNVDWHEALKNVEWSKINYGGGKPAPPAAPEPAPVTTAVEVQPTSTDKVHKPSSPDSESEPSAGSPTSGAPPKKTGLAEAIDDLVDDIKDFAKAVGLGPGANSRKPNGAIWLGSEGSDYQITFVNEASKDASVLCWDKMKMWNVKEGSLIFARVKSGESLTVSVAEGMSGGCGPVFEDSKCSFSGIIDDSILEFTAHKGTMGAYQISRIVNMDGVIMTATGINGCTSGVKGDELSCIFGCSGGAATCGTAGSYNIVKGADTSKKCNVGEFNGQPEGGCQFGEQTEDIQVTFSDSRAWPKTQIKKYSGEYAAKRR